MYDKLLGKLPEEFFGYHGVLSTLTFEGDAGDGSQTDDTGGKGGGDTGGKDDKGEDKGKGADDKSSDSTGDTSDTHTITVGGKEVHMTLDELKEAAQKAQGADKKFQDAADMRKQAAKGVLIEELSRKLQAGTFQEKDVEEMAELLGSDPSAVLTHLKAAQAGGGEKKGTKAAAKEEKKVGLEDLAPEVKAAIQAAHDADIEKTLRKIEGEVKLGVDTDSVMSKIIEEAPAEGQGKLKETLFDIAMSSVRGRILGGEAYGPEMVKSVVQTVRTQIKNLGIPGKSVLQPPVVGFGPAGVGIAPEILSKEPIKRTKATEDSYEANAVKRFQQDFIKRRLAGERAARGK
jgi:hypothetical protein